jgi:alkaline phosphatase
MKVLSRRENGFILMVEAALIDKYSHPLDWERAVMDTIMLDKAEVHRVSETTPAREEPRDEPSQDRFSQTLLPP